MATVDLHRLSARELAVATRVGKCGMMAARFCATAVLALGLIGCASFGPYEGPQAKNDEHTLCYIRTATTPEQLQTLAKEACNGVEPHLHQQELDWAACPLLVPERLYFSCGTS
jgi:hypothetical protein